MVAQLKSAGDGLSAVSAAGAAAGAAVVSGRGAAVAASIVPWWHDWRPFSLEPSQRGRCGEEQGRDGGQHCTVVIRVLALLL